MILKTYEVVNACSNFDKKRKKSAMSNTQIGNGIKKNLLRYHRVDPIICSSFRWNFFAPKNLKHEKNTKKFVPKNELFYLLQKQTKDIFIMGGY